MNAVIEEYRKDFINCQKGWNYDHHCISQIKLQNILCGQVVIKIIFFFTASEFLNPKSLFVERCFMPTNFMVVHGSSILVKANYRWCSVQNHLIKVDTLWFPIDCVWVHIGWLCDLFLSSFIQFLNPVDEFTITISKVSVVLNVRLNLSTIAALFIFRHMPLFVYIIYHIV